MASELASDESARATPRTRVSFRLLLSHDFSRLTQMESLLADYIDQYLTPLPHAIFRRLLWILVSTQYPYVK